MLKNAEANIPERANGVDAGEGPAVTPKSIEKTSSGEATPAPEWPVEWAAERAAEALRYLGRNYPECLDALRALDVHEEAAHEAAKRGDRDGYLEALRAYMRAGRDEALRIRRGAA